MKLTGKTAAFASLLFVLIVLGGLFAPALFQGKMLAPLDITTTLLPPWSDSANGAKPYNHNPSDAVTQYIPYRLFAEKSLREDGYIGWNPYEMGGYSLAANTMALPGTWTMQLHRFLAFKDAWNLGIFAEFLIAGLGMLVFLRSRNLPWLPILIGAMAYMLNSQFICWVYHRWALGSFCWMPWVLWAYGDGFRVRPYKPRLWLLPFFLTMAMLGGTLQHCAFIVMACGCLAVSELDWRRPMANAPLVAGWAVVFTWALAMAAFTLVPQIQGYVDNLAIGHVRGAIGYESGKSQILFHALLIPARIWPWLAGDPQTIDCWRALKSGYMELNFIGTIPMILGFMGMLRKDMPKAAKWLVAVGLLTPLTPLVGPLYHRVELLFILGASWMAAEFLAKLPHTANPVRFPRWLIAGVAAIGLALTIGAIVPVSVKSKLEAKVVAAALTKSEGTQFGAEKEWIASRAKRWFERLSILDPRTAWTFGLLIVGSTGLWMVSRQQVKAVHYGHGMILIATTLELATVFHIWTTYSDPALLQQKSSSIEEIRKLAGSHRVLQSARKAGFADMFATPNILASHFVASIDGYESIQYRSPLIAAKSLPPADRLKLSDVAVAIEPPKILQSGTEEWPIVARMNGYTVRKNPELPPAVAVGVDMAPAKLEEMASVLTKSTALEPVSRTANSWSLDLPTGKSWLRIAQNWHAGWRWSSNGKDWLPFRNGADACCWIDTLPADARHLDVRFFPRPVALGWISAGTALLWAAWALYCLMRKNIQMPPHLAL